MGARLIRSSSFRFVVSVAAVCAGLAVLPGVSQAADAAVSEDLGLLVAAAMPATGDDDPIRRARQLILEDRVEEAAAVLCELVCDVDDASVQHLATRANHAHTFASQWLQVIEGEPDRPAKAQPGGERRTAAEHLSR